MTAKLGVVGAGGGGAAATSVLGDALPSAEITVFEKSRGVCGRAAARRRNGIVYEYGANYLSDAGGRVSELVTGELDDRLVEVDGPVWTFNADGEISRGGSDGERRWTYEDGITRLAKHLLGRSGAVVNRETRVVDINYEDDWRLTTADGEEHGPFGALLLNPPAPQTADLLSETGRASADRLGEAAQEVEYHTGWTAVLGYDFALDLPYYGLANVDGAHPVSWIGREEKKPGHVPARRSVLIVQASPEWASARYEDAPEENVTDLAEHAAQIVGDRRLATPDWTDHQGWRYAFAAGSVDHQPLGEAAQDGIYVTGDWVAEESRLDAAIRHGLETGERMVEDLAQRRG